MPVVTFAPSHDSGIVERIEWLTDVLTSYNGKEQRDGLRDLPRRRFDLAFAFGSNADRTRAENFLEAHHGSVVDLPLWQDAAPLAAPASGTSIPVATADRGYAVGARVVLVNGSASEVATITAVNAASLDVSLLAATWPAGSSYVAPVAAARLDARVGTANPWPAVMTLRAQFVCEDGAAFTQAAESADYLGYPVKSPDAWALDGNTDYRRLLAEFDPGVGRRSVFDKGDVEFRERQYRVALPDRASIAAHYAWLAARQGRLNAFWLPSGQNDLAVKATISSTTISVARTGYADMASIPVGRRDIMIETAAGVKYYRRILSAAVVDAATENLVINAVLGVSLPVSSIKRVSFMRLARLSNDSLELSHKWGGGIAEATLAVTALRDDV